MKLVTYQSDAGPRIAIKQDQHLIDLNQADASLPTDMIALLERGDEGLQQAAQAVSKGQPFPLHGTQLLAPIPRPGKVICIGLNYADHAKESGVEPPPEPVVFNKFTSSVIGPDVAIQLPAVSSEVDYEAELVVIIGKSGKHISASDAMSYIAGYCCGHDVSARDWQLHKPGKQWLMGKTFDTFAPLGPELVTADEITDPGNLRIQFRLNGETLQDSTTQQLIFGIPKLISYLSDVITLSPGDVIFTGTPPGVGMARKPPIYLKPGDIAEIEIEGLGVLKNPVEGDTR